MQTTAFTSFDSLGVSPTLLRNLTKAGFAEPTAIQAQAIPHALAGRDVLGCAQTGTGKTWLACAFGRQAARLDHSVLYLRMPRLFEDLAMARLDGRFPRLIDKLARVQLLILDDVDGLSLTAS